MKANATILRANNNNNNTSEKRTTSSWNRYIMQNNNNKKDELDRSFETFKPNTHKIMLLSLSRRLIPSLFHTYKPSYSYKFNTSNEYALLRSISPCHRYYSFAFLLLFYFFFFAFVPWLFLVLLSFVQPTVFIYSLPVTFFLILSLVFISFCFILHFAPYVCWLKCRRRLLFALFVLNWRFLFAKWTHRFRMKCLLVCLIQTHSPIRSSMSLVLSLSCSLCVCFSLLSLSCSYHFFLYTHITLWPNGTGQCTAMACVIRNICVIK